MVPFQPAPEEMFWVCNSLMFDLSVFAPGLYGTFILSEMFCKKYWKAAPTGLEWNITTVVCMNQNN